ncbi:MAG: lipopolysaccharide biosynthesis protein [Pseudomonadota bacterium]
MTKNGSPVGSKVLGGVLLNAGGMIFIRCLSLINIAILGRLLSPDDFGVVALAMVVVGFLEALTNNQFETALIRQKDADHTHYGTAFVLALLVGCIGAICIFSLAGPLAVFFNMPDLKAPLQALAVVPLLAGLRNPHFVEREKALNFNPRVTLSMTSRLSLSVVAITCAIVLVNYWALIWGTITMYVVHMLMSYALAPRLPRPSLQHWRAFLGFGGWLTGAGALDFMNRRLPAALLGRLSGAFQTGLYQVGSEIATTMTQQLLTPLHNAIFPGLMAVSQDRARLSQAYLLVQQSLLGLAMPVGCGIALIAPELVRVALGTQWMPVVPIIAVLSPITAVTALIVGVQAVVFIEGDTRALFLRNLLIFVFLLPMAIAGFQLFGMMGLVAAQGAALLLNTLLTLRLGARATDTALLSPVLVAYRSHLAVAGMIIALLALEQVLGRTVATTPMNAASLSLGLKILLGAVVCCSVQYVLWCQAGRPDGFEQRMLGLLERIWARVRRPA